MNTPNYPYTATYPSMGDIVLFTSPSTGIFIFNPEYPQYVGKESEHINEKVYIPINIGAYSDMLEALERAEDWIDSQIMTANSDQMTDFDTNLRDDLCAIIGKAKNIS